MALLDGQNLMSSPLALTSPRAAALALALIATPAAVAHDPVALGPEIVVNTELGYQQEWGKVAMSADGERLAVAFNSVLGNEVWVRFYNGDGTPRGLDSQVNTTLTNGVQDEPMLAMDDTGRVLIAWSDRNDHDGGGPGGMGCFGRLYGADDLPIGAEIQLNQKAAKSQWEPHPNALPGGGWSVTFNGDDDGNAYLTRFDALGNALGPDALINTFTSNGQTEVEHALTADGRLLTVFADFGGHAVGGTGTNLFARLYDSAGNALQPDEFLVNENTLGFDQLEPRMAAAGIDFGLGGFVLVWEDWGNDGSSAGIFARLYDRNANALGPEFLVNQTTAGTQRLPEVAADHLGNFCVTWEDASQGDLRVVARLYDAYGIARGDEFVVSEGFAGDYRRPTVALDASGERIAFAYSGPGKSGPGNNGEDVYLRLFDAPAIQFGGAITPGGQIDLAIDLPAGDGLFYILGASLSSTTGMPLPDGRLFGVDPDVLLKYALKNPNDGLPFSGFQGPVGGDATVDAAVILPANPVLVGLPMHFAILSFDASEIGLLNALRHVSRAREVTIF